MTIKEQLGVIRSLDMIGTDIAKLDEVEEKKLKCIRIANKDGEEFRTFQIGQNTLNEIAKIIRNDLADQYTAELKKINK